MWGFGFFLKTSDLLQSTERLLEKPLRVIGPSFWVCCTHTPLTMPICVTYWKCIIYLDFHSKNKTFEGYSLVSTYCTSPQLCIRYTLMNWLSFDGASDFDQHMLPQSNTSTHGIPASGITLVTLGLTYRNFLIIRRVLQPISPLFSASYNQIALIAFYIIIWKIGKQKSCWTNLGKVRKMEVEVCLARIRRLLTIA